MSDRPLALFDLDGTISRGDTYLAYLLGFLARRPLSWPRAMPLPTAVAAHYVGWRDNTWLKTTFLKAIMGGRDRATVEAWTVAFLAGLRRRGLRRRALDAIDRHKAAGDRLVLATASPDLYVVPLGSMLGFDEVICTRTLWGPDGRLTGALDGGNCYGANKLDRVRASLDSQRPGAVTFYSDHHSDLPLLQAVDSPVVVNPSRAMSRTVAALGMRIEHWD
jgi:HAD superfamily hydrolase (TIGR01490 family)